MEIPQKPQNPLTQFMRQPKIYIRLPSQGEYYASGSLVRSETGEYPVYSMTAKDEILLKIPDALLNGQAVVDVIENCVPNIKNAWAMPQIDVDIVLIAIRIATYGEKMKFPISLKDDFELDYEVDLRNVMDQLMGQIAWDPVVPINPDLTVYVKPLTYKNMTDSAIQTFETQKIIQLANDDNMDEQNKVQAFKESFAKLTNVTVNLTTLSIYKVESSAGTTENPQFIKEFIDNADKEIFNKINLHIEDLKFKNTLKPISIPVNEEMRKIGVEEDTIELPLVFDAANFFG